MKSTAINTVYVVMHAYPKDKDLLDLWVSIGKGYLMWTFADEREAIKACNEANSNIDTEKEKYYIAERTLW